MRNKYRQMVYMSEFTTGTETIGESVVKRDEVESILSDIEDRVKTIIYSLDTIKGLDLIDEIKCMCEKLANDLY